MQFYFLMVFPTYIIFLYETGPVMSYIQKYYIYQQLVSIVDTDGLGL